jgi:hypothetical protein
MRVISHDFQVAGKLQDQVSGGGLRQGIPSPRSQETGKMPASVLMLFILNA